MNKHFYTKRIAAGAAALIMAAAQTAPAFAQNAADDASLHIPASCDEAYYVTTDAYGGLLEGSIVKSYIMNEDSSITDYGSYDSISNLTNEAEPQTADGTVVFDLGNDAPSHFYFEGSTAKPFETLPWTVSLHYTLNGAPARAEDLAGKTGVAEIFIDAVPNPAASDYMRSNYTLAMTSLFNQDDIISLEAPGAQVQLIGNLRAVLFICLPGEEKHVSIRVGAENFEYAGLTCLMTPVTLDQMSEVSALAAKKAELEDDYRKLSGSLDTLLDALDGVSGNLNAAAGSLDELDEARQTVSDGKDEIYKELDGLNADVSSLSEALKPLNSDIDEVSGLLGSAMKEMTDLNTQLMSLRKELGDLQKSVDSIGHGSDTAGNDARASLDRIKTESQEMKKHFDALSAVSLSPLPSIDKSLLPVDPSMLPALEGAIDSINLRIDVINSEIAEANTRISSAVSSGSAAAGRVAALAGDTDSMLAYANMDVKDLKSEGWDLSSRAQAIISEIHDIYNLLDDYEPKAQKALDDLQKITADAAKTLADASSLLGSTEALAKKAGSQLDKGAADSLKNLAATLRSTSDALGSAGGIKEAKDGVSSLIEDTWKDYTGRVNDLLNADPNAPLESLTDARNPEPASVQVMIRTAEIKMPKAAPAEAEAPEAEETNFFGRIGAMFTGLWNFFTGLFK